MDPYHYIRCSNGLWIIGGEDHKTGMKKNTEEAFNDLNDYIETRFDSYSASYHWSGQILEPVDGLPYIGLDPGSDNIYIATGFSGNGMTFGTLSGMMISDFILKKSNPWKDLYSPSRIKPLAAFNEYIKENKDYPLCMIFDRVSPNEVSSISKIKKDEGKTIRTHGQRLAIYRDTSGDLHAVSAVCPHLGCLVHWNSAEKTWDCPCHGSRFDLKGNIVNGPALKPLEPVSISEQGRLKQKKKKAA
jgi:Rieske Fe-S protein